MLTEDEREAWVVNWPDGKVLGRWLIILGTKPGPSEIGFIHGSEKGYHAPDLHSAMLRSSPLVQRLMPAEWEGRFWDKTIPQSEIQERWEHVTKAMRLVWYPIVEKMVTEAHNNGQAQDDLAILHTCDLAILSSAIAVDRGPMLDSVRKAKKAKVVDGLAAADQAILDRTGWGE